VIEELGLGGETLEALYSELERRAIEVGDDVGHDAVGPPSWVNGDFASATTDALQLFLNEAGRYPLLGAEQEVALAKCVERGDKEAKDLMVNSNERGLPGRGSSCNPSMPRRANRPRHFPTVEPVQPSSAPTSVLDLPSAAANTIRHRNANACELFGRRAHRSSTSRSSPASTTSARCAMIASHRRRR
jgi:hypothetical protein